MKIQALEILSDEIVGSGGFLAIRRTRLKNRRADGSESKTYLCDFVSRPCGADAVAIVLWRRRGTVVEVLLRHCLRPAVGLRGGNLVGGELSLWEVVAGILENEDGGDAGIDDRAIAEVWEEAGYRISGVEALGAPFFASPGSLSELVFARAAEIEPTSVQEMAQGDGSPMEEGAVTRWVPIDDAVAECMSGQIRDLKTEVLLRRLRDVLA